MVRRMSDEVELTSGGRHVVYLARGPAPEVSPADDPNFCSLSLSNYAHTIHATRCSHSACVVRNSTCKATDYGFEHSAAVSHRA
jgi:hypothetical protein